MKWLSLKNSNISYQYKLKSQFTTGPVRINCIDSGKFLNLKRVSTGFVDYELGLLNHSNFYISRRLNFYLSLNLRWDLCSLFQVVVILQDLNWVIWNTL